MLKVDEYFLPPVVSHLEADIIFMIKHIAFPVVYEQGIERIRPPVVSHPGQRRQDDVDFAVEVMEPSDGRPQAGIEIGGLGHIRVWALISPSPSVFITFTDLPPMETVNT